MSVCKVCGKPFRQNSNVQKYCEECSDYYDKTYKKEYKKERLGNPRQDIEVLRFLRKKRE
jgi:hypothetical protein